MEGWKRTLERGKGCQEQSGIRGTESPVQGLPNLSPALKHVSFIFKGQIPSSSAIIGFDCEGLRLHNQKDSSAASVAFVGKDVKDGEALFHSFVHYPADDVQNTMTFVTDITREMIAKTPMDINFIRRFLHDSFLINRPTIVGWDINKDWALLGIELTHLRDFYGSSYDTKVIDLQKLMQRYGCEDASLELMTEVFHGELRTKNLQEITHQAIKDARATYYLYTEIYLKKDKVENYIYRVRNCRRYSKEEKDKRKDMFRRASFAK